MRNPTRLLCTAAGALLAAAAPLRAQQPTLRDSLLDRLVGRWVLRGTIQGAATTHDVTADWVLGHQYVRIQEASRVLGEPSPVIDEHRRRTLP